ncbi:hypothetical protein DTO021D3_4385 [Paecilomyces variotii]|nr:hypothetical protein DTO032I3_4753 [Paecilomyces variotii]KAJ9278762.1 hypothetical protein DTO021D3_4385 [Paecilomyces variotii]KAJ9346125.1 hypothetical protein DTO027B6_1539 [Paecilomyces variotii]KAJ9392504.1 hypothetical protein DTO032I4_918 [Paecilomyces variotii]
MLATPGAILEDYAVSLRNGFLPDTTPLAHLPEPYYNPWETIAADLPDLIKTGRIREEVEGLPILSTDKLHNDAEWRRAYVVLAFLTHAYIWGGQKPKDVLPPVISRPFLEVSEHLELPPCATYAALNLWNYAARSPDGDLTDPDNLMVTNSFTNTIDEEWFLMVSVAIEARGAKAIPMMLNAIDAVNMNDSVRVTDLLNDLTQSLGELAVLLERMYEKCSPPVFYHEIRPFLAGSKNMAAAGLPDGVFYDRGDGNGEWRQYSGGSNAQSSLIQLFDIVLGVEHRSTGERSSNAGPQTKDRLGFIEEMRNYMPGPHRRFLALLSKISNIRPYAMAHASYSDVRRAYNEAVLMLGVFRDKHIQIVSRYIIMQSRLKENHAEARRVNLATASSEMSSRKNEHSHNLHGTGGTSLIPFLKQTRDETRGTARYTD